MTLLFVLLSAGCLLYYCHASPITQQRIAAVVLPRSSSPRPSQQSTVLSYINENFREEVLKIKEDKAVDIIKSIQAQEITLAKYTKNGKVETSFVKFASKNDQETSSIAATSNPLEWLANSAIRGLGGTKQPLPLVLLHGFDSSCIEYRRLAPLLNGNRDVFIPDILGWGFSDHSTVTDFSPAAKLAHLESFIKEVVRGPCVLVGASLGGGIAINFASNPQTASLVDKVVLLDAQGFIDGEGPRDIADNFALLGISVLKSTPLRMLANVFSYRDKLQFSTWDALLCGRLHCFSPYWERASVEFLRSGGFIVSSNVARVAQRTLVIFGANDDILDKNFPQRFKQELPDSELLLVEECGHVPHLERPTECARAILQFLG